MPYSMSQRVVETMSSGSWNDFTDLPGEFISQFAASENGNSRMQACYQSRLFVNFSNSMDDILIAACFLATVINLVVVVCSARLFQAKGDTLHLFILNMTIGDCILTLFCHPYELLSRRYSAQIHVVTVFLNFANWVGLAVSGLSLTLLNVDKLIFFCWPFKYDIWMSYFRAKMFCYLTWLISLGFATYYWVYSYLYYINTKSEAKNGFEIQLIFLAVFTNEGRLSPVNRFFYEAFTVIFCVIPIVSSLMVSCYLYSLTNTKRKLTIGKLNMKKPEKKATSFAFIFATTLWTSCSLLPYRLANLARIHIIAWPNLDCESKQMLSWITWSMLYLLILNPIVNPLITVIAYAPYRQMVESVFFKIPNTREFNSTNGVFYHYNGAASKLRKSNTQKLYVIELRERSNNNNKKVMSPKAPLAKFHSVCSCGSMVTSDSLQCTRF